MTKRRVVLITLCLVSISLFAYDLEGVGSDDFRIHLHAIEREDAQVYSCSDGGEDLLVVYTHKSVVWVGNYDVNVMYKNTAELGYWSAAKFGDYLHFPDFGLGTVTVYDVDEREGTITIGRYEGNGRSWTRTYKRTNKFIGKKFLLSR
jgi:hypothetical protein